MKYFFFNLLIILSINALGQNMPTGSVYGKVIDSATNRPIDAVSIQILQNKMDTATKQQKPVLINGMLTDAKGEFRLESLPAMGMYEIHINAIGYKTVVKNFSFIDRNAMQNGGRDMGALVGGLDRDLGNIKLGIDQQILSTVTVTSEKPAVQLGIDRKIYNVERDLSAAGGTAQDILKNVPSVSVDIDGNVSVRNGSPQIFVDGRPTTLTLDQIPADQIETVEVITNPSSKYDASGGTAGILNIVLKKTKRLGYSGNIRAGIDQRLKPNFGLNANLRQGKFNFFAMGHYGSRKGISDGTLDRKTYMGNTTLLSAQTDRSINTGRFMFGRAGFDFFLDNRNTITVYGMGVNGKFDNETNSTILVDSVFNAVTSQSKILRYALGTGNFKNLGGGLSFVHNFEKSGHQFSADANYNKSNNVNENNISNENYYQRNGPLSNVYKTQQLGSGSNERLTAQIDYTNPLTDNSKFETGLRMNQSKVNSLNDMYMVLSNTSKVLIPPQSSNFKYKDQVLAGYVNYSSKIGENFGYQVGLRLESSSYDGTVHSAVRSGSGYRDSVSNFSIKYPISLFPSVFISQKLNDKQDLQFNYSRRINRPGFFQLFPFVDYSDTLNLSRGNPTLKPEFVSSFELSYSYNFNRQNTLLASVYYKYTNDLITRYQAKEVNPLTGNDIYVNTYLNANSSYVTGLEIVSKNQIKPWWDITSNLNLYTSKINVDDVTITNTEQIYSWFAKLNNNFKLPKNFTFQLSGDYTSKSVLAPGGSNSSSGGGRGGGFMGGNVSGNAQGYSMPSLDVDAALKYEFLKDKAASVTLSVSDIFKTQRRETYTTSPYFDQHQVRVRDQQFFRLNFSYRFGKFDASLFKRKKMNTEQDSGGMENMGGGQ